MKKTKKMGATFRAPTKTSVTHCVSVRNVANGKRSVLKFVSLATRTLLVNREEKSFRHVAMVATFLNDSKPKTALKKWIFTLFLIQFHLICQMLAKFSRFESERTLFTFRKKKENCTYSISGRVKLGSFMSQQSFTFIQIILKSIAITWMEGPFYMEVRDPRWVR